MELPVFSQEILDNPNTPFVFFRLDDEPTWRNVTIPLIFANLYNENYSAILTQLILGHAQRQVVLVALMNQVLRAEGDYLTPLPHQIKREMGIAAQSHPQIISRFVELIMSLESTRSHNINRLIYLYSHGNNAPFHAHQYNPESPLVLALNAAGLPYHYFNFIFLNYENTPRQLIEATQPANYALLKHYIININVSLIENLMLLDRLPELTLTLEEALKVQNAVFADGPVIDESLPLLNMSFNKLRLEDADVIPDIFWQGWPQEINPVQIHDILIAKFPNNLSLRQVNPNEFRLSYTLASYFSLHPHLITLIGKNYEDFDQNRYNAYAGMWSISRSRQNIVAMLSPSYFPRLGTRINLPVELLRMISSMISDDYYS